jgi:hypothetical protein
MILRKTAGAVFAGLLCISGYSAPAQENSIQPKAAYIDYDALKSGLGTSIEKLISSNKVAGMNTMKARALSVKENQVIDIAIQKNAVSRQSPEQLFEQSQSSALMIGRYATTKES